MDENTFQVLDSRGKNYVQDDEIRDLFLSDTSIFQAADISFAGDDAYKEVVEQSAHDVVTTATQSENGEALLAGMSAALLPGKEGEGSRTNDVPSTGTGASPIGTARAGAACTGAARIASHASQAMKNGMDDDYQGQSLKSEITHHTVRLKVASSAALAVGRNGKQVVHYGRGAVAAVRSRSITAGTAVKGALRPAGAATVKTLGSTAKAGAKGVAEEITNFPGRGQDFSSAVPSKIQHAVQSVAHGVQRTFRFFLHPIKSIKTILIVCGVLLLSALLVVIIGVAATVITTIFCSEDTADVQQLVVNINRYRDEAVMQGIYSAFRGERDPNGNPYGFKSLDGSSSNNVSHGVTWRYANGISNDTAEIISAAAVYYQQNWPSSSELKNFFDSEAKDFIRFCRYVAEYGLDVIARESSPYACIPYGGCVEAFRSEGDNVTITEYEEVVRHACEEGNAICGRVLNGKWIWYEGHAFGHVDYDWSVKGTREVTVYFPVILPGTAEQSELTQLPADAKHIGSMVSIADMTGNVVLDAANLYKGQNNDWFWQPGELTTQIHVSCRGGSGAERVDTYTVTFHNASIVPWCPGTLHDGTNGHYDLDVSVYLKGYDEYEDPELEEADGEAGGSGNLIPLLRELSNNQLTREVLKQNQYGQVYSSNATSARFTKTITLPPGDEGFTCWFDANGEDVDGNVEWATVLYKMDWEDLYGVTDGIKCKTLGTALTDEELRELLEKLGDTSEDRAKLIEFALSCIGRFGYSLGGKASGGPGAATAGAALDCSGFIQYVYWSCGYSFAARNTWDYRTASDIVEIGASQIQPGDMRVVYAQGGESGHVQMYLGGGRWVECAFGAGVITDWSNAWMDARPCHYFTYIGF